MKRTDIYLDEENHRIMRHLAVKRDTTASALIREAIQQYLRALDPEELSFWKKARSNEAITL